MKICFHSSVGIEKVHENGLELKQNRKTVIFRVWNFPWDRLGLWRPPEPVPGSPLADRACYAPGKQVFVDPKQVPFISCCRYRERCPERVPLAELLFSVFQVSCPVILPAAGGGQICPLKNILILVKCFASAIKKSENRCKFTEISSKKSGNCPF